MSVDTARYRMPPARGPSCTVGKTLANLDPNRAADLKTILADPLTVSTQVERYSEEDFGIKLKAATVRRHVRGVCACD